MPILSLTTDLGNKDYYAAAVKASALAQIEGVQIVDITHEVPAFNIAKAAFVLRNVWQDFPKGSIHIIGVDTQWSQRSPWVVISREGHFFIGTDNGVFSLLFDSPEGCEVYALHASGDAALGFPTKGIFIPAAAKIAAGTPIHELGTAMETYRVRPSIKPVVEYDNIRGTVIYVDGYGNVITNITKSLFYEQIGDKRFNIVLKRGDRDLNRIRNSYGEVQEGEKVATFTSSGYLEIAINRGVEGSGGGASGLLGLREDDTVRIEFGD